VLGVLMDVLSTQWAYWVAMLVGVLAPLGVRAC
jgi:hypothetical protein